MAPGPGEFALWRIALDAADDVIPPISPNDVLSPVVTYAAVEWYATFRLPPDAGGWARTRALLALVAFNVNVIVI